MENMEKRMEKAWREEAEELEMNARMVERADDIDNAAYRYLAVLLELDEDGAEERFPWNIEILRKYLTAACPSYRNTATRYATRILPHRRADGSTAARFPSADVRAVTVRMN